MNRALTTFGSIFPQDLVAMEIYADEIVLIFPDGRHSLCGKGVHRAAPLLAMGEPLPHLGGEVFAAYFRPGCAPLLDLTNTFSAKRRSLARPLALPPETEWVLFDTQRRATPKWLVKLCDLRRITLSRRGRVCVVFNDHVFAVMPRSGITPRALFDEIDRRFPIARHVRAQPGEISVFSTWPIHGPFLQPFARVSVAEIELLSHEEDIGSLEAYFGDLAPQRSRLKGQEPPGGHEL